MGMVEAQGIITREVKYGDTSRILTVVTREFGKISVLAGGVRTNRSGLLAATQLFSYVSLNLFQGRGNGLYKIQGGEILTAFSSIRESLERMAYASYFCQVTNCVVQEDAPDPAQLSLLLNAMHMLAGDRAPYPQIKAVFEFRTLAEQGLLPPLDVCRGCGKREGLTHLDLQEGGVWCGGCAPAHPGAVHTGAAILQAIAYIAESDPKKIFAFQLPEASLDFLSNLGEYGLEYHLERRFTTLDYLKKVLALGT